MPDGLRNEPFAWTRRGDEVVITHQAKPATILRREAAARFLERVALVDDAGAQQLMARMTGNFKRGNERR